MKDQVEFPESLEHAFEHIKALHLTLAAVMIDVAALRSIVLKNAKLTEYYQRALASESVKTRAMIQEAMREYDEEIARLKFIRPWKN
jgi:hypothetical protein